MTWDEDYYLGSSDYPLSRDRQHAEPLWEAHEEPEEAGLLSQLEEALGTLTERQRFVIELRWGLRGERGHSLREISDLMSLHHSTVQGHFHAAMRKLESYPAS